MNYNKIVGILETINKITCSFRLQVRGIFLLWHLWVMGTEELTQKIHIAVNSVRDSYTPRPH